MKKQKSGVILNASSYCAKIPHANGVLYAATKAAVSNMTRSTAAALAPYGIRVCGYIPGMIVTPISESMIGQYKEQFIKDIDDEMDNTKTIKFNFNEKNFLKRIYFQLIL